METEPYPTFQFQHPSMMMVVGPTQSGKSYFVEQLLSSKRIKYPSRKTKRIQWFYTQWQPLYDRLQSTLGKGITFTQGLPNVNDNLEDISDKVHNLWVLDDLMDEAVQSPIISQLFTRGRHRNLSVILLLQNMFRKGKFNTSISRNAQYMVLFRSPSDRKQMDIIAERIFAKDRPKFMSAYMKETEKPYGYIILDNHPKTTSEKQVIANVFGDCYAYPNITKSTHTAPKITDVQPKPTVTHKVESPLPKQPVKRKTKREKPPAKRKRTEGEQTKPVKPSAKKVKTLPKTQTKPTVKRSRKPAVYKAKVIRESSEEEDIYSNEDEKSRDLMNELNELATQNYFARQSRGGFSFNPSYE